MILCRAKLAALAVIAAPLGAHAAQHPPGNEEAQVQQLKNLSLADLGNVEVTTVTKEPEGVWQTPAAITRRNLLQPQHQEFNGDNGNRVGIRRTVYAGLTWMR